MKVGVWIDHRNATLVFLENDEFRVEHVAAEEAPPGVASGRGPLGSYDVASEPKRDRRSQAAQHRYYQELCARLRGAGLVYILGPGDAKHAFLSELDACKIPDLVTELESADKLTEAQLVARVRDHFGKAARRHLPRG